MTGRFSISVGLSSFFGVARAASASASASIEEYGEIFSFIELQYLFTTSLPHMEKKQHAVVHMQ